MITEGGRIKERNPPRGGLPPTRRGGLLLFTKTCLRAHTLHTRQRECAVVCRVSFVGGGIIQHTHTHTHTQEERERKREARENTERAQQAIVRRAHAKHGATRCCVGGSHHQGTRHPAHRMARRKRLPKVPAAAHQRLSHHGRPGGATRARPADQRGDESSGGAG